MAKGPLACAVFAGHVKKCVSNPCPLACAENDHISSYLTSCYLTDKAAAGSEQSLKCQQSERLISDRGVAVVAPDHGLIHRAPAPKSLPAALTMERYHRGVVDRLAHVY